MAIDKHEINDQEKQFFIQLLDGLDGRLYISDPDISLLGFPEHFGGDDSDDEHDKHVTHLEREATLSVDDCQIVIERSDTFDTENNKLCQGNSVTTSREVLINGLKLVTEKTYMVDWHSAARDEEEPEDEPKERWKSSFEQADYEYDPEHPEQKTLLDSDYRLDAEQFYAQKPTDELRRLRQEAIQAEEQTHDSDQPYEARLTRSRYWEVVALLQRLVEK